MERQSTTLILMKILRDLNLNTNIETREQQRRFVHERFQRSNKNIERCITHSNTDLTDLISNFSDIYISIDQSKTRVEDIRERLRECKNLLLLKRQDIRKLWLLTSEQNALVRIYNNLDELKRVPIRLQFYLTKRLYLHATLLLLRAREHQELRLINALIDIDLQIKEERSNLEDQLRFELLDQLFDKPSRDTLGNKNLLSSTTVKSFDENTLLRVRENRLLRKQFDQEFHEGKLSFESHSIAIIPDKYLLTDIRHQSTELYLDVLLQSLSILSNLNETLDFLQKQLHEQFYRIILHTTQHILDNNFVQSTNTFVNNPNCLRDLLEISYEQFKHVVKNFEYLLNILKLIQDRQSSVQIQQTNYLKQLNLKNLPNEILFEIPYIFSIEIIWETLQQVLSDVLYEYIDYNDTIETFHSTSSISNSTDYSNQISTIDFSQYLTKRAPIRSQQIAHLFEFSQSAQFNSLTTYLQEQNRFAIKQNSSITNISSINYKQYVCKPNYRNMIIVHDILQHIIEDIDQNICLHSTKRILDRKLTDFIRDRFIGRVIKDNRESAQITSSTTIKDQNHFIDIIPSVLQKQLQISVPILQSSYLIFKSCEELFDFIKCLPIYADEFCQAISDLLFKHRESCQKLYLSIVERNNSKGISIYSNEWVKDPDINRHLRTTPAFDTFIQISKNPNRNLSNEDNIENIRVRETKETETLAINFGTTDLEIEDICTNYKHIQILATIHESLNWLYSKLLIHFDILDKSLIDIKNTKLSRLNLEILSNAMKTILNLSQDILLVLFIEIRVHCYYYLQLVFRNDQQYIYVTDLNPDENILNLNRDLTRLQEILSLTLNKNQFAYIFQGIGVLLSSTLINWITRFSRISESGVTKLCRNILSIEQTVSQIRTVGDAEIRRAYQYYELLYLTKPEDILHKIEEDGQIYSEQDYLNLMHLQYRSFTKNDRENFDRKKYEKLIKQALNPSKKNSA